MPITASKTEINRARSLSCRTWSLQVNLAPSQVTCAERYDSGRWPSPDQIVVTTRVVTDWKWRLGRLNHAGLQTCKAWLWVRYLRNLQNRKDILAHQQRYAVEQDPHTTRHQALDITWAGRNSFAATAVLTSTDEATSGDRNRATSRDKTWFQTAAPGWILDVDVDLRGDEIIGFQYSGASQTSQ